MMDHRYDRQCQCPNCNAHERAVRSAMAEEYRRDREYLAKRRAMVKELTTVVTLKPAA